MTTTELITSKAILEQTGISRATLNNYIKLGILPRPVISSPGPDQHGIKQIGYFPAEALLWISQVKLLKQQGNSMNQIAGLFQDKDWVAAISAKTPQQSEKTISTENVLPPTASPAAAGKNLKVTINDLTSPAYLINNNFEIEWINEPAEKLIFQREVSSIVNIESRNIFKLLLDRDLHAVMQNWNEAIDLHCTLLQRNLNRDDFKRIFEEITPDQAAVIAASYQRRKPQATDNLYHLPFSLVSALNGQSTKFIVHSVAYREGTFLVFVPADQNSSTVMNMLTQREQLINELLKNKMPSMVSLCALVASFENSEQVCAELLPSQYFLLMNDLWQTLGPVFEKYYGTYGKHAGDNILYYFVKSKDNTYLMNAINCSLELREVMSKFSLKWKNSKGWRHDLHLNIGIHDGREFFGTIQSGGNIEFTSLGDSVKVAGRLSSFAGSGEIWVTKDLISKISSEERQDFQFGVYQERQRGKVMQAGSFSLARDLIGASPHHGHLFDSISNIAITEITNTVDSR